MSKLSTNQNFKNLEKYQKLSKFSKIIKISNIDSNGIFSPKTVRDCKNCQKYIVLTKGWSNVPKSLIDSVNGKVLNIYTTPKTHKTKYEIHGLKYLNAVHLGLTHDLSAATSDPPPISKKQVAFKWIFRCFYAFWDHSFFCGKWLFQTYPPH